MSVPRGLASIGIVIAIAAGAWIGVQLFGVLAGG